MPFTSIAVREADQTPTRVVSLHFKSRLELINRFKEHTFSCPDCGSKFCIKKSQGERVFFSHLGDREISCTYGLRSTAEHSECVILLLGELVKRGISENQLIPERRFGNERRADLCLTDQTGKPLIVFEVQLSRMDDREFLARTEFYHRKGIDCIWLFKKENRATARLKLLCERKFGYFYAPFTKNDDELIALSLDDIELLWNERIGEKNRPRYWNHYKFVDWSTEDYTKEQEILDPDLPCPNKVFEVFLSGDTSKLPDYKEYRRCIKKADIERYQSKLEKYYKDNYRLTTVITCKDDDRFTPVAPFPLSSYQYRRKSKSAKSPKEKETIAPIFVGEYQESRYPDRRYQVTSFGHIFNICKPLGTIKTALGTYYHFESTDPEFPEWKGYKFFCFRKEDFTELT
jgi:hypothetical protein